MAKGVAAANGASKHIAALKLAVEQGKLPPKELLDSIGIGPKELGISGTTNWRGDIYAESNTKLIHEQAYGQAGARAWGEWEKILRTDPDVNAAVEFTAAQIRDARVDVEEADEESQPDRTLAKAQADFVRWNLLEALEPGWSEVVQQMTRGALGFGFSLHEVVLGWCESKLVPGGLAKKVVKLAERLPSSIHPMGWLEENGELRAVKQQGQKDGGWVTVELPADKLLLHSWNRSGNNYLGYSAFRPVWYLCKIREQLLKLVGITYTREGAGLPVAYADDKDTPLSDKQRKQLLKLLANNVFHENAAVVMPAGWTLEWVYSAGANKGHVLEAWSTLGTAILRQVQAQQMALGTGATGSRSVGEVHSAVSDGFVQGVVANLEQVLNGVGSRPYTGLVKKLIDANWGPQPAYPKLTLTLKQAKLSAQELATAAKMAKDAGLLTVTLEDEQAMRERLGLAPIDEAEWEAAQAQKQALAEQLTKTLPPKPGEESKTTPPAEGTESESAPRKPSQPARLSAFTPRRALRSSEQHLDLAAMASYLDTSRDTFERGARPLVVELLAKLLPDVREAMKDGDPSEVASLKLDTSRLEAFIGQYLEKARAEGYQQVKGERARGVQRVADARADGKPGVAAAPMHLAAGDEDDKDHSEPAPSPPDVTRSEKVLEAQKRQLAKRMGARLQAELENEAIEVVRTGGDADEVVARVVQRQLETGALRADAGTVLSKAFNIGRDDFAREHGDEVESVELSAILDNAVCEYCEEHDGDTFEFESDEHDEMTPPLRDCDGRGNCRCVLIYNFEKPGFSPVDEADDE